MAFEKIILAEQRANPQLFLMGQTCCLLKVYSPSKPTHVCVAQVHIHFLKVIEKGSACTDVYTGTATSTVYSCFKQLNKEGGVIVLK